VQFADIPKGGSVAVFGLGPVGQFCARIASLQGAEQVLGVDLVPGRLEMARRHGIDVVDASEVDDVPSYIADQTGGRGADSVIDAVGMEAHGSPIAKAGQMMASLLPSALGQPAAERFGVDRLEALMNAIASVRRSGTISITGVYGGAVDPLPMMELFDKGVTIRMGQCHVKRWVDDIMPMLLDDADPLATNDLATHHMPLDDAPRAYEIFQKKEDGCVNVVLQPAG
jgi:threonine dehydrogenase-like Zn-dependent dehydrogenase